ncbi:MAG: hypothetical protein DWQ36_06985 [Acidobacteria bacterium]|nr:MAG: hypothetical protein DWQ30_24420 [Acidobacteriota bacterium]REK09286.1 MAG: hypothetical protein DWQ36_06985 [Acidobacteriota bacterium]
MERELIVHRSHEAAAAADRAFYASLTPQQLFDLLLELVRRHKESLDEAERRFERVLRVAPLEGS